MLTAAGDVESLTAALRAEGISFELEVGSRLVDASTSQIIVTPSDIFELSKSLALATEHDIAVTPMGGGTRLGLGNVPDRIGVAVSLAGLDGVVDYNPADLTATFQAGITIDSLQRAVGEHGQFLAVDPPLPQRATIGGTLAVGTSGPTKWQYGSLRDVVIGMRVVQPDGIVTKSGGQVVKNVSGYDMSRLHIGGLGTLGITAEASFKLTPLPAKEATLLASFGTVDDAVEAALEVFKSEVVPLALTTFTADAVASSAVVSNGGAHFLAIRLGGGPRTLERQARESRSVCTSHQAAKADVVEGADAAGLWRNLADFGWDGNEPQPVCTRSSVVPSRVSELAGSLDQLRPEDDMRPAIVTHPAHGTVQAVWRWSGAGPPRDDVVSHLREARDAASRSQGTMVIERCPSDVKLSVDVWGDVGESVAIMRRLKEQYDPGRILNPGRFAGGI